MSDSLQKYLVLMRPGYLAIQEALNEFYKLGYKVKALYPHPIPNDSPAWYAFIELDDTGYENVTNLKDVPPEEVDAHIVEGWQIASASISTKFVRMVKRRKPDG